MRGRRAAMDSPNAIGCPAHADATAATRDGRHPNATRGRTDRARVTSLPDPGFGTGLRGRASSVRVAGPEWATHRQRRGTGSPTPRRAIKSSTSRIAITLLPAPGSPRITNRRRQPGWSSRSAICSYRPQKPSATWQARDNNPHGHIGAGECGMRRCLGRPVAVARTGAHRGSGGRGPAARRGAGRTGVSKVRPVPRRHPRCRW